MSKGKWVFSSLDYPAEDGADGKRPPSVEDVGDVEAAVGCAGEDGEDEDGEDVDS